MLCAIRGIGPEAEYYHLAALLWFVHHSDLPSTEMTANAFILQQHGAGAKAPQLSNVGPPIVLARVGDR
jgi:hypothetical protein